VLAFGGTSGQRSRGSKTPAKQGKRGSSVQFEFQESDAVRRQP
jgi:hypothetical protein